jgi:hypothetical protein
MTDMMTPAEWLLAQWYDEHAGNNWQRIMESVNIRSLIELVDDEAAILHDGMWWFPPGTGNWYQPEWAGDGCSPPGDPYLAFCRDGQLPQPAGDFAYGPQYATSPVSVS